MVLVEYLMGETNASGVVHSKVSPPSGADKIERYARCGYERPRPRESMYNIQKLGTKHLVLFKLFYVVSLNIQSRVQP